MTLRALLELVKEVKKDPKRLDQDVFGYVNGKCYHIQSVDTSIEHRIDINLTPIKKQK